IADEMAREEPQIRPDVEFGTDESLAIFSTLLAHAGNAVEHQHGRRRQLGIARAEQFAPRACQQVFIIVARLSLRHSRIPSQPVRTGSSVSCLPFPYHSLVATGNPSLTC